jgi:hypothetical protein
MIVHKGQPLFRVALVISAPDVLLVARTRWFGNVESELEQLAVDARCSPARILCVHTPYQFADFAGHLRSPGLA